MVTLSVIATPIGNRDDITPRALRILQEVTHVFAEDTRVARQWLTLAHSSAKLISCHQHSNVRPLIEALRAGNSVAYISDAGAPGISDPGGQVVATVREVLPNVKISPIPGASALICAAMTCGWPVHSFTFLGFPPHKKGRKAFFSQLKASSHPFFFFESVHRIPIMIKNLIEVVPLNARIYYGRELTKKFESIYEGVRDVALEQLAKEPLKGEFVIGVWTGCHTSSSKTE